MGKTKKLAEELQETIAPNLNLEPPRVESKAAPKQIKMKGIDLNLNDQLVTYLQTRPYNEVAGLLSSLSQSPVLDVTITQQ